MKWVRGFFRHVLVWLLPALLVLVLLAGGFAAWLVGSPAGTRLLLQTAVSQFGGYVEDVRGSLWRGLQLGHVDVTLPGVSVSADAVALTVAWGELAQRRVRVSELSLGELRVVLDDAGKAPGEDDDGDPGVPALPVQIVVDRLVVGRFSLLQDGQPLPVALDGLQAALSAGGDGAQVRIASLHVSHPIAQADVEGEVQLRKLADPWPLAGRLHVAAQGVGPDSPLCLKPLAAQAKAAAADRKDGKDAREGKDARKPAAKSAANTKNAAKSAANTKNAKNAKSAAHARNAAVAKNEANAKNASDAKNAAPPAAATSQENASAAAGPAEAAPSCTITADARVDGSLQGMDLTLDASGAGAVLALQAALAPQDPLPLRNARLELRLPDRSSAVLDVQAARDAATSANRITGTLAADRLDVGRLAGAGLPPAMLDTRSTFSVDLTDDYVLRSGSLDLEIGKGSRWNRQPLEGKASVRAATGAQQDPAAAWPAALTGIRVDDFAVDLRLGRNQVRGQGKLGPDDGAITLDAQAPELAAFWPDLAGAANMKSKLTGTPARHRLELRGSYTPANARAGMLGRAAADIDVAVAGGWGRAAGNAGNDTAAAQVGWRGAVDRLTVSHAGFQVSTARPIPLAFLPQAAAPLWQWQVGPASVAVGLPSGDRLTLDHAGSRGGAGRWETAGRVDNLVLTPALAGSVMRAIDPDSPAAKRMQNRTRNTVNAGVPESERRIALDASWDLKFAGTLSGRARVARRSGDLRIPGDPPIALGLKNLVLDLTATPVSASSSRLDATIDLATASMGTINGKGSAVLAVDRAGGMGLAPRQPLKVDLHADIADLAWLGLFVGDTMEVGGSLKADVQAQGALDGPWQASGTIRGQKLRLVRIDDGVRLVDGTLSARLQDDRLILDSLRFPNTLRVPPADARTREWITKSPDAKNGYVEATGQWSLASSTGKVRITLYRFSLLQRADRYAMVSGQVDIDANLPRVSITGNVKADAGWASIEVLSEVPTLDEDVHVLRAGQQEEAPSTPLQLGMDLSVDLGSRFYLTGMGLDTGLVGTLQLQYVDRRLIGMGALRTRGGRIEAYGQRLQLRRGTVTFQGSLDNPLLDIEALRTGEQVEAGVRVSGTAQRPRIDLISYPDVSDVEKLSWLVLGRGPDASGNDTALLVSVGTALLGNGTPFYKQFGLDDVSIRNGTVGNTGSLLPDQTVAGNVNLNSDSTLATQFLVASKNLSNGITLSVEQAMAGAETVGRISYRLSRRWSVDLKAGSVSGLDLIYRTFFDE